MVDTEQPAAELDVQMLLIGDAELSSSSDDDEATVSRLKRKGPKADAKRKPRYKVGTRIRKRFPGHGKFEGVVTSFDGHHYRVEYVDGDRGDMSESEFELSDVELLNEEPVKLSPFVRKRPSSSSLTFDETIGNLGSKPERLAAGFVTSRGSRPLKKRRFSEESYNIYLLKEGERATQEGKAKEKKKEESEKNSGGKGGMQEPKEATQEEANEANKLAKSAEMKESSAIQAPGERTAQMGNPSPRKLNAKGRKEDKKDSQMESKGQGMNQTKHPEQSQKETKTLETAEPTKKKSKKGGSRLLRELADFNAIGAQEDPKPKDEKKKRKGGSRLLKELADYNGVGVADDGKPSEETKRSRRRGRKDSQEEKPKGSSPKQGDKGDFGTKANPSVLNKAVPKRTKPQNMAPPDTEETPASADKEEHKRCADDKKEQSVCKESNAKALKPNPKTAPGKKGGKTGGQESKAKAVAPNPITPCDKQQSAGEGEGTNGNHSKKEEGGTATSGVKKKKKGSRLLKQLADHLGKPAKRDSGKHRLTITAALSAPLEDEFVATKTGGLEENRDEATEEKTNDSGAAHAAQVTPDRAPHAMISTPATASANAPPANPSSSKSAPSKACKTPKINAPSSKSAPAKASVLPANPPTSKSAPPKTSKTRETNVPSTKAAPAKAAPAKTSTTPKPKVPSPNSAKAKTSKTPKYQVGTLFLKSFGDQRYGGSIIGFNGRYYKVRYPQDGDEEELSDNDFDGSDIEIFPTNRDDGYDTDDTKSETDSGRKERDDASLLEEDEFSDDENEIYGRIITVSNDAPLKKGRKRNLPQTGEQSTAPKTKRKRIESPKPQTSSTGESYKIPRREKKLKATKPSKNIRAVSDDFKIPRRKKKSDKGGYHSTLQA